MHELSAFLLDAVAHASSYLRLVPWQRRGVAVTAVGQNPGDQAINIGGDNFIEKTYYQGQYVGIHHWHKTSTGEWCVGWIPFSGTCWQAGGDTWDVQSFEPLTITPSLLCLACGSHGFIREGAWVQL